MVRNAILAVKAKMPEKLFNALIVCVALTCVMTVAFAAPTVAPTSTDSASSITTGMNTIARSIFNIIRSVIVCSAAVACIWQLLKIVFASSPQATAQGFDRIKTIIFVVIGAWVIVPIISSIVGVLNSSNLTSINDLS